jgi:hypothetical protein
MTDALPCWHRGDAAGPATHALVVGTSTYPHRPLGLPDLPGAATSADLFARWLRDAYPRHGRPVGTIRLLLAPSDAERTMVSAGPGVLVPDRATVHRALHEWARDCATDPGNVAVLYICGHGIQETDDGATVFVHDAAAYDPLDAAVDIAAIRKGMTGPGAPGQQWYFVDACRVPSGALSGHTGVLHGGIALQPRTGPWPAHRPVFFAAEPGAPAWQSHRGSVFVRALLECLELHAVEPLDDTTDRWGVTAGSLLKALRRRVRELARLGGENQRVTLVGERTDATLIECAAPQVPVTLVVTPAEAERIEGVGAEIFDGNTSVRALTRQRLPVAGVPVAGGLWTLAVTFDPPCPPYVDKPAIALYVRPPSVQQRVVLQ